MKVMIQIYNFEKPVVIENFEKVVYYDEIIKKNVEITDYKNFFIQNTVKAYSFQGDSTLIVFGKDILFVYFS